MVFIDKEPGGCASPVSLGISTQLMKAIIECAVKAGIEQVELEVISDNTTAMGLYKKFGFKEFGRNPKGFKKRMGEYQELISMRKEL